MDDDEWRGKRGAEGSRRQMREMVAVMGKRESGRGGSSMAEGGREDVYIGK